MIDEIKKLDKTKMFQPEIKKKKTLFDKIRQIFGYGKKG
jgi:hypothetical protein